MKEILDTPKKDEIKITYDKVGGLIFMWLFMMKIAYLFSDLLWTFFLELGVPDQNNLLLSESCEIIFVLFFMNVLINRFSWTRGKFTLVKWAGLFLLSSCIQVLYDKYWLDIFSDLINQSIRYSELANSDFGMNVILLTDFVLYFAAFLFFAVKKDKIFGRK